MTGEARESIVGGIVLVTLILATVLLQSNGDIASEATSGTYPVNATFNRVDGLKEDGEVRLGGIRVGFIERQRLDSDYQAVVTMQIDGGTKLPMDTSAAIHTDGLFGDKYIVLEPGGDEQYLGAGDEITFTQDAMVIDELLELIIAQGKMRLKEHKKQAGKGED